MHRLKTYIIAQLVACAVALSLPVPRAFAWGADGHRIIGAIAQKYLTAEAKTALADLLGGQSLGDAGCWADEIRSNPDYNWVKPMHFVNVPRDAQSVDVKRDCPTGNCVVSAIEHYKAVVGDVKRPREDRIEALKLLIHFVGDVHQSLHVSYADDRGGNSIMLTFLGKRTNLHALWDTDMIQHPVER